MSTAVCFVLIMWIQEYSLCKGLVLQWYVVDLDNTLVLLEELLLLGKAVFLDPFNVKPQSPCKAHIMNRRYDFIEVNTYMITCYRLTSICIFRSQHCQLLQ